MENLLTNTIRDFAANYFDANAEENFTRDIAYTGFNPQTMLQTLKGIEANEETFRSDMAKLIILSVERGSNLTRMVTKMNQNGSNTVQLLVTKYRLVSNARGAGPTAITLPRVALTFPWLACSYMIRALSPAVPFEQINRLSPMPRVMTNQAFASLIPRNLVEAQIMNLRDCHLLYMLEFHYTINPGETRPIDEVKEDLYRYFNISYTSNYLTDAQRRAYLDAWNLVNAEGKATDEIADAAVVFRARH